MDSSRRSYLIAAAVIVVAMVVAAMVVGVPGCGDGRPELSDSPGTSTTRPGAIPQDPDPGDGVEVEESYGDSGPQSAGPLQMRAVANTGATVIYSTPMAHQILYRTKTKGVTGVVNLAPAAASPSIASTISSLSARNPANTTQKTTRSATTVAGVKGVRVATEVGPPSSSYAVTTLVKVKGQVLTIGASGPQRKRDTVDALAGQLIKAVVVKAMSDADADAVSEAQKKEEAERVKADKAAAKAKADAKAAKARAAKARADKAQSGSGESGSGESGSGGQGQSSSGTTTKPKPSDYSPLR